MQKYWSLQVEKQNFRVKKKAKMHFKLLWETKRQLQDVYIKVRAAEEKFRSELHHQRIARNHYLITHYI